MIINFLSEAGRSYITIGLTSSLIFNYVNYSEASSQISWDWQKVPGLMASISKGNSGIWGLGNDGKIYKKNPTGDGKSSSSISNSYQIGQ